MPTQPRQTSSTRGSPPKSSKTKTSARRPAPERVTDENSEFGGQLQQQQSIGFSTAFGEKRLLNRGLAAVNSSLKLSYRTAAIKDELSQTALAALTALVFVAPTETLDADDVAILQSYLLTGGCVIIFCGEGANDSNDAADDFTRINVLSGQYGIQINNDAIVSPIHNKECVHPKELVLSTATGTRFNGLDSERSYIYPFGCSLTVEPPAVPIITTGDMSFPQRRCVCALANVGSNGGRLIVCGSYEMIDDAYNSKLSNGAFLSALIQIGTNTAPMSISNDPTDMDMDASDAGARVVPDMSLLSTTLRSCLQDADALPADIHNMFDTRQYGIHLSNIAMTARLCADVGIEHAPLTLIPPTFEVPMPPLQLAVHHPIVPDVPPPSLELFDLELELAPTHTRINALTSKAHEDRIDEYIAAVGDVLGVTDQIRQQSADGNCNPQRILAFVLNKIIAFKSTGALDQNIQYSSDTS